MREVCITSFIPTLSGPLRSCCGRQDYLHVSSTSFGRSRSGPGTYILAQTSALWSWSDAFWSKCSECGGGLEMIHMTGRTYGYRNCKTLTLRGTRSEQFLLGSRSQQVLMGVTYQLHHLSFRLAASCRWSSHRLRYLLRSQMISRTLEAYAFDQPSKQHWERFGPVSLLSPVLLFLNDVCDLSSQFVAAFHENVIIINYRNSLIYVQRQMDSMFLNF